MQDVTFFLAILLGLGFLFAKLVQRVRLPSVTGYILAGLLLGPSGLDLVTHEVIGARLSHFTRIALMLIAFGIGEHLEFGKLRNHAKSVSLLGVAESLGAFVAVALGVFLVAPLVVPAALHWGQHDYQALALLLGAIAVTTAPATTLHITREVNASGPLTATLLSVVAVDNGIAIMLFGMAVSAAHNLAGAADSTFLVALSRSIGEIFFSLLLGVATGLLIDIILRRLRHRGEMLTVGLSLLLLCGELTQMLGFSSLLAGMAAGFTIVNRNSRDVRLFRVLNAFETPIYVLFFTLAGAHLDLSVLAVGGWLGAVYFIMRVAGKMSGVAAAARLVATEPAVRRFLPFSLVPQSAVAISLIILANADPGLSRYSSLVTQVVLAAVVVAELLGPFCTKQALERSGEAQAGAAAAKPTFDADSVKLVPWSWEKLTPVADPAGVILFGASHQATVASLTRMTTLLAHHYGSRPLAVRIVVPESHAAEARREQEIFAQARLEARSLGYELATSVLQAKSVAEGILAVAAQSRAAAIVLGHPLRGTPQAFQRVVDAVAAGAACPVVVVRFAGVLHTERILVPVVSMAELEGMRDIILALAAVGKHRLTLMRLLPAETVAAKKFEAREQLKAWARKVELASEAQFQVVTTEARVQAVVKLANSHDLLVMAASRAVGLSRLFLGSLAEEVAQRLSKPLLIVQNPAVRAEKD
ncbi:MAG: cation:proton antiporter [Desulfobulbaceae bacterium]|nr:cation:proton antiporter [Desulfobulbaceae bacterium]